MPKVMELHYTLAGRRGVFFESRIFILLDTEKHPPFGGLKATFSLSLRASNFIGSSFASKSRACGVIFRQPNNIL